MKTFWLSFRQNFTDLSEGATVRAAVERLGMTMADLIDWREIN